MNTTIRTFPAGLGLINPSENKKIRTWAEEAFGGLEICQQFQYNSGADYFVLVYAEDEFVSFAAVIEREIKIDDTVLRMGGVGGVVTPPEHRGKGYATIVMKEVSRVIFDTLKADIGGLLCLPETAGFYEQLDWQTPQADVFVERDGESVPWPATFMAYQKEGGPISGKTIDLCGLPW